MNVNPYMNYGYYNQLQNQNQFQNYQMQQTMNNNLTGRQVSNFNEITASDIPMDGSVAYFPKSDLSEIECRQWNANGTISKIVFKPFKDEEASILSSEDKKTLESAFNEFTELFNSRLDKLEKMIKPTRAKKEVEEV